MSNQYASQKTIPLPMDKIPYLSVCYINEARILYPHSPFELMCIGATIGRIAGYTNDRDMSFEDIVPTADGYRSIIINSNSVIWEFELPESPLNILMVVDSTIVNFDGQGQVFPMGKTFFAKVIF